MSNNHTKYTISPDRAYVMQWDDGVTYEVSGDLIMSAFRRDAYHEHILEYHDKLDQELLDIDAES